MALRQLLNDWQQTRTFKVGRLVVATVGSVGLAWAVLHSLDWGSVLSTFQEFPITLALLALLPFAASMVFRAYRWGVLMKAQPVNGLQVFLVQNTGIGLNNLLPIRMVSEPIQLAVITRHYGVPGPIALATLVAGNTLDIFATALLMTLGVILEPELRGVSIQLAGAFILFIVSLLVFIIVARGLTAVPIANRMQFFQRLTVAVRLLRESPHRLWASFAATAAHWFFLGLSAWVLAQGLHMELNVLTLTTLMVAVTFFTSAVPSLPGAAGTYEFAMIYTLRLLGVDDGTAFAFAIMMHIFVFLPSSSIALYMISRLGVGVMFRKSAQKDASVVEKPGPQEPSA